MALLTYDFKILNSNALKQVLESNEQRVKRHNAILARSMQDTSRQATSAQRQAAAPRNRSTVDNELKRQTQQHDRYWNQAAKRAADHRLREELRVERHLETERKAGERRAAMRARVQGEHLRTRLSNAGRAGFNAASAVGRTALTVAGIGGGFLAASAVQGAIEKRQAASQLANQIRQPELKGVLEKEAGGFAGFNAKEVLGAEKIWHGLTGDIKNVRQLLPDLTDASLATGASLDDLASALGNTFVQIDQSVDDPKEKLVQMRDLLKSIAGMGTIGGIDIQQLAPVMAGLAAQGGRFQGGASQAIKLAVAQAEASRMSGGSASPEESVTAVQRFADDLIENKKVYQSKGINVYADKGKTKLRSQADLIPDIMEAAGGNLETVSAMFGIRARRAVEPYRNMWLKGGGKGGGGKKAVSEYLQTFMDAKMTDTQIKAGVKSRLEDPDIQIKEAMKKLQGAISADLLPEVTKLVHKITELTPALATLMRAIVKVVDFFVDNPFIGLGSIVETAILKEFIGAGIADAVKRSLVGPVGSAAAETAGKLTTVSTGAGAAAIGLLKISIAAAAIPAVMAAIDQASKLYNETGGFKSDADMNRDARDKAVREGRMTPQAAAAAEIAATKGNKPPSGFMPTLGGPGGQFAGPGMTPEVPKNTSSEVLAHYQAIAAAAGKMSVAADKLIQASNAPNRSTVPSSPKP